MFRSLLYDNREDAFIEAAADFMIAHLVRDSMIHESTFQALIRQFPPDKPFDLIACQEYYFDHIHEFAVAGTEQVAVVKKLRALGIKTAMVTNVAADRLSFQRNKIDTMGLTALFDVIVLSGEIGVHKPDRRVFDYATRQLGVANEDCVFVGDNPDGDITGAINAGMEAVWIDVWGDGDRFAGNPRVHRVKSVLEYFQF
jgi:putative hydrolase of the HAD superfamily